MFERVRVDFETDGVEADDRFVREYALSATERLRGLDVCEDAGYLRYGHEPGREGGMVSLFVRGDTDAVVAAERDRWDGLVASGLAREWTVRDHPPLVEQFGEEGAVLSDRLIHLASRMSARVYEEFDDPPAPADSVPDEGGEVPVGWWTLLHFLADQQAYDADDEIDAYAEGVRNRLFALTKYHGAERASDRIDDLIADLEATRDQCEAFAARLDEAEDGE